MKDDSDLSRISATANQLESGKEGSLAKTGLTRTRTDLPSPLPFLPKIKQLKGYVNNSYIYIKISIYGIFK